jgi:MGT family glycosyltransferase
VLFASLGTVFAAGPNLLRTIAVELSSRARTVVVATGRTPLEAIGPLPPNVIARPFVPQTEVLDRAALFVTHGGMNSVNEALHAGVPMLVIPQGADQPTVAARVSAVGAGLAIRPDECSPSAIGEKVDRLLQDPGFRLSALRMRHEQRRAGGYRRAASHIEEMLGVPRSSSATQRSSALPRGKKISA